jgi:NAD dependent epimerase/dehydratase family enzyme
VLGSVRATPKVLLDSGFDFRNKDIGQVITAGLEAGR